MSKGPKNKDIFFLAVVGLAAWAIPGGGYILLGHIRRALVVSVTILLTFGAGLYIGSIGVIDSVGAKPWYIAQVMNSPAVIVLGNHVAQANTGAAQLISRPESSAPPDGYPVFGRSNEMGQIYTSIAGLLNLLCIVNAVYLAHLGRHAQEVRD
jgi:hypothetical protein